MFHARVSPRERVGSIDLAGRGRNNIKTLTPDSSHDSTWRRQTYLRLCLLTLRLKAQRRVNPNRPPPGDREPSLASYPTTFFAWTLPLQPKPTLRREQPANKLDTGRQYIDTVLVFMLASFVGSMDARLLLGPHTVVDCHGPLIASD